MPDGMPPMPGGPPGGSPGGQPPQLPGNPAGGPAGAGASPAMSPGAGAGNQAAARAIVGSIIPMLHKAQGAFPWKSKEYAAVSRAIESLRKQFGQDDEAKKTIPAQIQAMMQESQQKGPAAGIPSPGLAGAPKPPGMIPGMPGG